MAGCAGLVGGGQVRADTIDDPFELVGQLTAASEIQEDLDWRNRVGYRLYGGGPVERAFVRVEPCQKQAIGECLRVYIGELLGCYVGEQVFAVEVPERMQGRVGLAQHDVGCGPQETGAAGQLKGYGVGCRGGRRCTVEEGFEQLLQ